MPTRPRDSQWGKVRDAIAEVPQVHLPNKELQEFVDRVLKSRWFRSRYRTAHPAMVKRVSGLLLPPDVRVASRSSTWQGCDPTDGRTGVEGRFGAGGTVLTDLMWTPCTRQDSPDQPTEVGALHVLSHLLVDEPPLHSPAWAMNYLKLLERFGPTNVHTLMRASFKQHRVRTYEWSNEAKLAAKDRYAQRQFRDAGERARALVAALEAED